MCVQHSFTKPSSNQKVHAKHQLKHKARPVVTTSETSATQLGRQLEVVVQSRSPAKAAYSVCSDADPDEVPGWPRDCNLHSEVQCSMCSAIHIILRTLLRPSSTLEPSDPPLRVFTLFFFASLRTIEEKVLFFKVPSGGRLPWSTTST